MRLAQVAGAVAGAALATICGLALPAARAAQADASGPAPGAMTAEQIVDKSVEVRGGLQAWRKITTVIWEGHLESARSTVPSLRFRLEEKRPGKSRFEINEPSQRSMRVFNGTGGWKMKLGQDGRPEIKPFTAQEIRFARSAPGLEGPLIDFRAKGSTVELQGTEELEGRKAYRIDVRLSTAEHQTVWIDVETFLESRYDRTAYDASGARGTVSVRFRDYREIEGLAVPSVFEISGAAGGKPDRMVIERVALNPEINDSEFDGLGGPRSKATAELSTAPR
jgi:outer membrane lipoprotein-sorting protein